MERGEPLKDKWKPSERRRCRYCSTVGTCLLCNADAPARSLAATFGGWRQQRLLQLLHRQQHRVPPVDGGVGGGLAGALLQPTAT